MAAEVIPLGSRLRQRREELGLTQTEAAMQLDVARTTVRRAERRISELNQAGEIESETVIHFVNRASDAVYAMARFADVDDPALFEGRGKG